MKEEKHLVYQELINIMNDGLENDEKLTSEILQELKNKIEELMENDF